VPQPRPRRAYERNPRLSRYSFGSGSSIAAGGYYLLCCSADADSDIFGINPFDTITLLDAGGSELSSAGPMVGDGGSAGRVRNDPSTAPRGSL